MIAKKAKTICRLIRLRVFLDSELNMNTLNGTEKRLEFKLYSKSIFYYKPIIRKLEVCASVSFRKDIMAHILVSFPSVI